MTAPRIFSRVAERFRLLGRALAHRNFRLFFFGQGVSLIGTWMTRIATSWLVFRLAPSESAAFLLGVVGFVGQIPTLLLAPLAGVMVDRWDRQRLLIVTQVLAMVESFLLAAAAAWPQPASVVIAELMILSFAQGVINAFDMPGRQAFLIEMVEHKEDLGNAIALNSSLFNGARLVGPAIAGVLIALIGETWCFFADGVSYIAVIVALAAMRVPYRAKASHSAPIWQQFREGLTYAFGFPPIRWLLGQVALVSFLSMSFTTLMPVYATRIRAHAPEVMGFLMAACGVGAVAGALVLASRRSVLGLARIIAVNAVLFGIALVLFGYTANLWLASLMMLVTGFAMIALMAACNTMLQTIIDEDKRGRLMSLYTMAVIGMSPFGSLAAGVAAEGIGAPTTAIVCGAIAIVSGVFFGLHIPELRTHIRPIYIRLGILPEMARGIETAGRISPPLAD